MYIRTKDYMVSHESFDLLLDEELMLLKTHPFPSADQLPGYYKSDDYISHTDAKRGIMERVYRIVKKWAIKQKLNLVVERQPQGKTLLDIGAGTGDFLVAAKNRGWTVSGIEPNEEARKRAHEKSIQLVENFQTLPNQKFDVITMWHVLEHIPNLSETIQKLHELLNPNGVLIIAVPNYKSYDAQHYKEFWAAYDVPRHLWHFSQTSIKKLFRDAFELEKINPMVFDAYYVSLLSEKYKTGNTFSPRAFWIGWRSNRKARRSGEFSSLIYCLKRK